MELLGSNRMKKILIVAAAAGLMSLAACSGAETANEAAAENLAEVIEEGADNLEDMADNATNETAEAALENAADNLHEAADNVEANAH
jgi:hypothetical protein